MSTVTSQIRAVRTALYDALVLREDLAGVTIFKATPSPGALEGLREWITLSIRTTGRQQFPFASTRVKYDEWQDSGEIWVVLDTGPNTDDAADSAQERAEALLGAIEDVLRRDPSLGRTGRTEAKLTDYEHTYTGSDTQRAHQLGFTVENRERMHSS